MPRPAKGARMGGSPSHERLILANLATALFEHGRITTTEARAKRLKPVAERLVQISKKGDLHARRRVLAVIRNKDVVHHLFTEIGPRYENRDGGYTRIIKVGPRKGDNAPMAVIELVEALDAARAAEAVAKRAAKEAAAAEAATAAAVVPVVDDAPEETVVDEVVDSAEEVAAVEEVEAIEAEVSEAEPVEAEAATADEATAEAEAAEEAAAE